MPSLPITITQYVVALVLTVIGCVVQGSVGIGYAVIVAPILMLYAPPFVPGPIVFGALMLVIMIAIHERRDVIVSDLGSATLGRVVGTIPGAYMLSALPTTVYELLFGMMALLGVAVSMMGWHIPPTRRNVFTASIFSGFMSTVSSMGGPPMALVYQNEEGPRIRATISAIFMVGAFVSLVGMRWAGRFGMTDFLLGLALLPGVVAGFLISRYTASRMDAKHVRPALLAVTAICGVAVIGRSILLGP